MILLLRGPPLRRNLLLPAVLLSVLGGACSGGSPPSPYSLSLDRSSVLFEADYRGAIPASEQVQVTFVGDGVVVGFPPGSVPASWLGVSAPPTVTGQVVPVSVGVVTTELAPATYSTTLRFYTGKADGSAYVSKDLDVRYVVYDQPILSGAQLAFSTIAGASVAPAEQPLQFTFGGAGTAWAIESDQPWLSVDRTQGSGSGSVQVRVDPAALAAGIHTAHLVLRAVSGRLPATATVQLTIEPRRIWASLDGVALASVPGHTALQREVALYDNAGAAGVTWSATSDQGWLSAEPLAAGRLRLTADPTGLPAGQSVATVTVTSDGAQVENAVTIRVGLWKADVAPPEGALVDLLPRDVGSYPSLSLAVDPIRPRLYVLDTGSEIRGFNVYTGALEVTFPLIAGEDLGSLVVSSDGRWLFAGSTTNLLVHRLDLDAGVWGTALTYTGFNYGTSVGPYIRPKGYPVLLGNVLLDVETGRQLTFTGPSYGGGIVLEDQSHLLLGDIRSRMDYDRPAGVLRFALDQLVPLTHSSFDVGASRDGSRVYSAGTLDYGYGFSTFGLDTAGNYVFRSALPCPAYPSVAEVGDTGVLYAGRNAYYDADTVTAYGPDDAPLGTYSIGTYRSLLRGKRGLKLSSDGQRLLLLSTESAYGSKTTLWGFKAKP